MPMILIGLGVFGAALLIYWRLRQPMLWTHASILKAILADPEGTLRAVTEWETQYTKQRDASLTVAKYLTYGQIVTNDRALRVAFHSKCPLFLMTECVTEGGRICELSRAYCAGYRATFAKAAVDDLVKAVDRTVTLDRVEPAQYVGYASGGNFQDLDILVRALNKRPHAQVDVHLIDLHNRHSLRLRDAFHMSCEVTSSNHLDVLRKDVRAVVEGFVSADGNPGLQFAKQFAVGVEHNEARHLQLIRFLRRSFPAACIALHMYTTAESYLDRVKNDRISTADVVTTADLQNFETRDGATQPAVYAYTELCSETLKRNPFSTNLSLSKSGDNGAARLVRIVVQNHTTQALVTHLPYRRL